MEIVNVYAPNQEDPNFFVNLLDKMSKCETDFPLIVGGLNIHLDVNNDIKSRKVDHLESASSKIVNAFLEEYSWADIWRVHHSEVFQFTWKNSSSTVMSRIDYLLCPINCLGFTRKISIAPATVSDHCPVYLDLEFLENMRGPGYWKFNEAHLQNKAFVDEVNKIIDLADYRYEHSSPTSKWESLKQDIKEFAIKFSKEEATKKRTNLAQLERQLQAANKKLAMINLSSTRAVYWINKFNVRIDNLKLRLLKESLYATQGAMLRSKSKWLDQGEHNTCYFLSLEKRNAKQKIMQATMLESGRLTRDPRQVLAVQRDFYAKLYKADVNIETKLDFAPEKKVPKQTQGLGQLISLDEIKIMIKEMAWGKSPRLDGFGVGIYIVFFNKIKQLLVELFNYAFQTGNLHASV